MKKVLFPFVLLASLQATAQTKDSITKVQTLKTIEVSAVRAGDDAPFAKKDISGKTLDKENLGQDLPMLLQYTPSAVVTSDAGAGVGYTGIRIRGTDPTRINVTMNGIPVNDPEEQATFFVDIPDIASSTGSIQIQRGVGTSTNGAGSFGATVSINNLKQLDSAGAIINSSAGSFNTYKNTLMAGTGLLKSGWQFDVRLSKINSDGYIQRATTDLKALQFTAGYKASENTWLHFMVMTGSEKTGQAWDGVPQDSLKTNRTYNELGLEANGTFYPNQTDNYQQTYYQAFIDHKFSPYFTGHVGLFLTQGRGYYEEYHVGETLANYGITDSASPTTDLVRQLWLDNSYYGGIFSLQYERNKTQITLGGGISQFENLHYGVITWTANGGVPPNYKWYQDDAQKNDYNVYAKLQQRIGKKMILFADVQLRNVAYYINGFQDDPTLKPAVNYLFFNPKVGISYIMQDNYYQKQRFYASMAVGNKEPNHDDFDVDNLNVLPKPETLYDGEAGYEFFSRKFSFNANLYYMYYYDQLVLTGQINSVGGQTQTNTPSSYRAGIELIAGYAPTRWLKILGNATFSQNKIANYTYYLYDTVAYNQYTYNYHNTNISFAPSVVASGSLIITPFHHLKHHQNVEIDINEKYVSKQYMDNSGDNTRVIDAYSYCNVLVRYSFVVRPFKEVAATVAVNNVFNQMYSTNGYVYPYVDVNAHVQNINYYFPQAGTNFLAGLSLRF